MTMKTNQVSFNDVHKALCRNPSHFKEALDNSQASHNVHEATGHCLNHFMLRETGKEDVNSDHVGKCVSV